MSLQVQSQSHGNFVPGQMTTYHLCENVDSLFNSEDKLTNISTTK